MAQVDLEEKLTKKATDATNEATLLTDRLIQLDQEMEELQADRTQLQMEIFQKEELIKANRAAMDEAQDELKAEKVKTEAEKAKAEELRKELEASKAEHITVEVSPDFLAGPTADPDQGNPLPQSFVMTPEHMIFDSFDMNLDEPLPQMILPDMMEMCDINDKFISDFTMSLQ